MDELGRNVEKEGVSARKCKRRRKTKAYVNRWESKWRAGHKIPGRRRRSECLRSIKYLAYNLRLLHIPVQIDGCSANRSRDCNGEEHEPWADSSQSGHDAAFYGGRGSRSRHCAERKEYLRDTDQDDRFRRL